MVTPLFSFSIALTSLVYGQSENDSFYESGQRTRDGIGKYYLGREIAQVMGHQGIPWLERDNREDEEAPSKAISLIDLKADQVIADIGAGSGYYSFRIAQRFPESQVIAVDIQPEMLEFIKRRSRDIDVSNIETQLGTIEDIKLPAETIDAALFVDAYHEFSHPYEVMQEVVAALSPRGRLALVEYRGEDRSVPIKALHKMTVAQAEKEMAAVGLALDTVHDELPWQHVMIFRPAGIAPAGEAPAMEQP